MLERHLFSTTKISKNPKIFHSSSTGFVLHQQCVFIYCMVSIVHLILYDSHPVRELILLLLYKQFETKRTS